jgi:hypothetical protein
MSNTIQFTNTHTAFTTTGNVEVGKELTVAGNVAVDTDTLFVDSVNNRVGIGTTSPGRPLEIAAGGGGAILNIKRTDAGTGQGAIGFVNMNSNVCASITSARSGTEGGELRFFTAPNDTTQTSDNPYLINERMRIDADGNVGIGTTSPSKTLDIGFADGGSPGIRFTHTDTGGINRKTSGHEAYYTGLEAVIERYADKDVRYTGGNAPEVTHRINLGYSDSYTDSSGFYPQHHEMHFEVMNKVNDATSAATLNRIMTLRGNGNVGIGITTPSAPLDVRGVDNPDMMAMFKTVSAAMKFHTGQGGTSNNWKDTNISLSGGSGGGAILFCFTMNNSNGDRSGAILYFIRKSHTADGTTNGDWNNDSSSVFKISGLDGGGSATSLDFQRNGNKLEYRTSSVGNGYFYAIEFD